MSGTLSFWISRSFEEMLYGSKSKAASASKLKVVPSIQALQHSIFPLKMDRTVEHQLVSFEVANTNQKTNFPYHPSHSRVAEKKEYFCFV